MSPIAVIPLKGFADAKERLSGALGPQRRADLARATADRVATACLEAGFRLVVVTSDADVSSWAADLPAQVVSDPGRGLDDACRAGVELRPDGWAVAHGDLPLLDKVSMTDLAGHLGAGRSVIAPARDGGTNLLAADRLIPFAYGPGSFHRHLTALARSDTVVVTGAATAIEIDTPADLTAAAKLPGGDWLAPFLA